MPFKNKYTVKRGAKVIYQCITTTRNCEDMINILSERFLVYRYAFRIYRDDVLVWDNVILPCQKRVSKKPKVERPKMLIYATKDNHSGIIYKSRSEAARYTGIHCTQIGRMIDRGLKRFQYVS